MPSSVQGKIYGKTDGIIECRQSQRVWILKSGLAGKSVHPGCYPAMALGRFIGELIRWDYAALCLSLCGERTKSL